MEKVKNIINKIPKPLKNKYILTLILFIFWIVFLDDYNLINQNQMKDTVNELKVQKEFYMTEIKNDSTELSKLKNDTEEQEKFAREKFLMKKDNEDIFIIREKEDE